MHWTAATVQLVKSDNDYQHTFCSYNFLIPAHLQAEHGNQGLKGYSGRPQSRRCTLRKPRVECLCDT